MDAETLTVDIRTKGAASAAKDINAVAKAIGATQDAQGRWRDAKGRLLSVSKQEELGLRSTTRQVGLLGKAYGTASTGLQNFRRNTNLGATATYALHRSVFLAGGAILGLGALSVKTGIQFDATMEQNQVAFTNFLGSAKAARTELGYLYKTAALTPFETTNITQAAREMLAFGFNTKQANSWLQTIGNTIAGVGGGPQQIDQMVLALGQIKAKGQLQGQELLQLEQLGVVRPADLAKRLGVSVLQLHSGNANISADRALAALQAQWNASPSKGGFAGMAGAQSKTFSGQISTLHDNVSMALGTAMKPLFDAARTRLLPQLNAAGNDINGIFSRQGIDMSQKIHLSQGVLKQRLGPLATAVQGEIKQAHISAWLGHEFALAAPHVLNTGAALGVQLAKGMWNGFMHAGPYGKLFAALWLGKKTGALGGAFKLATGGGLGGLMGRGGSPLRPLFVTDATKGPGGGNIFKKIGNAIKTVAPTIGGAALKIGRVGGPILGGAGAFITGSGLAGGPFGSSAGLSPAEERRRVHLAARNARSGGDLPLSQRNGGGPIHVENIIKIGEREMGRALTEIVTDSRARRGGR